MAEVEIKYYIDYDMERKAIVSAVGAERKIRVVDMVYVIGLEQEVETPVPEELTLEELKELIKRHAKRCMEADEELEKLLDKVEKVISDIEKLCVPRYSLVKLVVKLAVPKDVVATVNL